MGARSVAATLVGLIAALVASFAIWRYAPPLSENLRLAASLAPLVLWGLVPPLLTWLRRRRSGAEAGLVRDQKKAVLRLLKSHGLGGRRARYRVPLLLVVGPDGVGKSSLVKDSGLELESGVRIGDAMWWIGDDAIFVEATIGAAHENMVRLASLLDALRPDLPLNSILLVLSPADLTLTDNVEHEALTQATVEAIREIETRTRRKYPLYMMLSKIDLVPGFREFFDRQEPQERKQIWGFSLPFHALGEPLGRKESTEALTGGFRGILVSMRARLVEWLSREGDPIRCSRINGFGPQIATLLPTIQPMLDALIPEKARNWNGAPLRGIVLTSTRQEILSIDPLLPELSGRFAMPRSGMIPPDLGMDEEDQSFFVSGAFEKAILPEAGLALKYSPRRNRIVASWAATACIVVAAIALGAFIYEIFDREVVWPARAQTVVVDLQSISSPADANQLPAALDDLQQLSTLGQALDASAAVPEYALGLSGHKPLRSHVARTREALLRNALAPHLAALMEGQLVDLEADVSSLNSLIRLADSSDVVNEDAFRKWLEKTSASLPESLRKTFIDNGVAALNAAGRITVDPSYVDAARRIIAYKESLS